MSEDDNSQRPAPLLSPQEKWTVAFQEGRRVGREDAHTSGRLSRLEERMDVFEKHVSEELLPKLTTMGAALEALLSEAKASRSWQQKWMDRGKALAAFLYRGSVFVMFLSIFSHNTELGKIIAPWIGKWLFP